MNAANHMRGESHCRAKLTSEDVRLIREAAEYRAKLLADAAGLSNEKLAEKFGVSRSAIGRVLYNGGWGHV